jgi:soluble lytic murein transglycosylase-like protein
MVRALRAAAAVVALTLAGSAATTYTVKAGDNLSAIGRHFGVSQQALTSANHLADPNRITIGEHLVIPDAGTLPSALTSRPQRLVLRPLFRRWARAYGVSPALVEALAWMESGWQNSVVSKTGAVGIGQLEPSTTAFVNTVLLHTKLDPRRPSDNIRLTSRFLRWLLDQTGGDVPTAIGGYYQGLALMHTRGPLPWTRTYITDILLLRAAFSPG